MTNFRRLGAVLLVLAAATVPLPVFAAEQVDEAKQIGAKLVIPCHYDMFEFNTATPDEFVAECQRLGQPYRVLKLGERWSSTELK